jgi:NADH:ubiquinone oxidoreductase subunit 6 (subunit J)
MAKQKDNSLFMGSLISSFLSAILILATDFSGWYNYSTYGEVWGWVGFSFDNITSLVVFGLAAGILFFSSYISYLKLSSKKVPQDWIQKAFFGSAGVCVISILGIIYFIVEMIDMDPSSWWLGASAYAGSIGGGLTAIFFHLSMKK